MKNSKVIADVVVKEEDYDLVLESFTRIGKDELEEIEKAIFEGDGIESTAVNPITGNTVRIKIVKFVEGKNKNLIYGKIIE